MGNNVLIVVFTTLCNVTTNWAATYLHPLNRQYVVGNVNSNTVGNVNFKLILGIFIAFLLI